MEPAELKIQFREIFGAGDNLRLFFSPGRVNLIGEHIDYNGGYVFPAALTIGIMAVVRENGGSKIRLRSQNIPGETILDIGSDNTYKETDGWGNYPKGIANYLRKEGKKIAGCDILFASNLPDGAGLSSSAALEVLTAFILLTLEGEKEVDRVWVSLLAQRVENEFIGVNCGIMDQFSVAMGKKDHAILLDCQSLGYKLVPFILKEHTLVIMNTNKRRELADSKYNERRRECDKALGILRGGSMLLDNLCQATMEDVNAHIHDPVLLKRARHVVSENLRVLEAVDLLEKGDIASFSKSMTASHMSLKDDYEVTGPELDAIVEEALKVKGCLGARMTGAGFGGCAIAIVGNDCVEEFKNVVSSNYKDKTGLTAEFYESRLGEGVHIIS